MHIYVHLKRLQTKRRLFIENAQFISIQVHPQTSAKDLNKSRMGLNKLSRKR